MQSFPERPKEEIDKLGKTLKLLVKILNNLRIEYRIFGSIIPAALLGKPQRKLGDIDLMVDTKDKDKLFQELREKGYKLEKRMFRFLNLDVIWAEAVNNNFFEITIFLGNYDSKKNFIVHVSKNLKIIAHNKAIKFTHYSFNQVDFIGIPEITGYYGTWVSRKNPKRKYDLAVFETKKIKKPPLDYQMIDFYFKNIKIPFLYQFSCYLQNLLGRISLMFGRNYDFWKK